MRLKTILLLLFLLKGLLVFAQTDIKVMTFNVHYDEALFHKGEPRPTHWANRKLL